MHELTDPPLVFKTTGTPRPDRQHLNEVLVPAFRTVSESNEKVRGLLATGTWDPDDAGCIDTFTELVRTLDASLDYITSLRETMPSMEWRAVHRELTRSAAEQARGQIHMAMTITAANVAEAQRLAKQGEQYLDVGARHAERIRSLIERIEHEPGEGPFQSDGSLDVAALAWSTTRATGMSITDGADLVRQTFAEVPGVAELPDERALTLLATLTTSARTVDVELLIQRAQCLRDILDAADRTGNWIADPALLADRINDGLLRLTREAKRVGQEWRWNAPRDYVLNSLTEIYRQLVEGALRELGGVITIAARASRREDNAHYELDVVNGLQAGDVLTELLRLGGSFQGAVDMTYRNASAHGGITVTDGGVTAIERSIKDGREVSRSAVTVSDAEFLEVLVALQELLLALQLAVLPWLWSHPDENVAVAVAAVPTQQQALDTLALLAGLAGLHNVRVELGGDHVSVSAVPYETNDVVSNATKILSVAPATFGAVPEAQRVTLTISGLQPVTFARAEFNNPAEDDEQPHELPMLGLTNAKWLLDSGTSWSERDEAAYVTCPITFLTSACARLVGRSPQSTENIDQAVISLRLYRQRLDDVMPTSRSPLTRQAVEQLDIMVRALVELARSRRGERPAGDGHRFAREAADVLQTMQQIQTAAIAVRDNG